jgi:predicted nucleic acid-binding Zn ribbon protein
MNFIKCKKCGANVPETKAFCPECGNAIVDEEIRQHTSEHDSYQETMRLTKSGYNLMLADMDLNISESPNLTAERINISKELKLYPVSGTDKESKPTGSKKWLMLAGVAVLILLLISVVLAIFTFRRLFTGS